MERGTGRRFVLGLVVGAIGALLAVGILGFFLFPIVLRHRTHLPGEETIGLNRVLAAIPRAEKIARNPLPPSEEVLAVGSREYVGNCSMCHGVQAKGDAPLGKAMYPPAVNLADPPFSELRDGEYAWIIRNGLSFVGMPSFKDILTDEEIWSVVHHLRRLQGKPLEGGEEQVAQAGGQAPNAALDGKALFGQRGCAGCHGQNAEGGVGPALAGTDRPFQEVLQVVRNGRGGMPAFPASVVPDPEVRAMHDWFSGE